MLKYVRGFGLIELMVTLAVAAIVLAIAIPSFNTQILNSRSLALGEDFAAAVNFARVEAVTRRARVSVCASSNGLACGGGWDSGFIAFVDNAASDTAAPVLVAGNILRVWPAPNGPAVINVRQGAVDVGFTRYLGTGALARISDDPVTVDVSFAGCTGNSARRVTIGLSGSISLTRQQCAQ